MSVNVQGPNVQAPNLNWNAPQVQAPNVNWSGPQVQAPNLNVNAPGINAYPPSVDVNGFPVNGQLQTGGGSYSTTTTTTTRGFQGQARGPTVNTYNMNDANFNANSGSYTVNERGVNGYSNVDHSGEYVEESTGCCNRRHRSMFNEFGHKRMGNEFAGNPSSLGRRRCCTGILIALGLLALAGLIAGIYFAVRGARGSSSSSSTSTGGGVNGGTDVSGNGQTNGIAGGYPGGYYVNGIFVVPITAQPRKFFLIFGTEMPCNPYDNFTITTYPSNYPNCNQVTTKIVQTNWTTTTPKTVYLFGNGYGGAGAGSRLAVSWVGCLVPVCVLWITKQFSSKMRHF